jgi:L-fucose isomerase-like protein
MILGFSNYHSRNQRSLSLKGIAYARLSGTRFLPESNSLENHIVRLARSGALARDVRKVIRRQKRAGLAVTRMRGDDVVKICPDGRTEILERICRVPYQLPEGVRIFPSRAQSFSWPVFRLPQAFPYTPSTSMIGVPHSGHLSMLARARRMRLQTQPT